MGGNGQGAPPERNRRGPQKDHRVLPLPIPQTGNQRRQNFVQIRRKSHCKFKLYIFIKKLINIHKI